MLGFNVLRNQPGADSGDSVAVNPEMILASHAGISAGDSYTFLDTDVDFGQMYQYKLEIVKLDGTRERVRTRGVGAGGGILLFVSAPASRSRIQIGR